MSTNAIRITFPEASVAEGNRFASTLTDVLRDADPSIIVDRQKERSDTQDFGATLAVIVSTAAVTAVAKGIAAWLARNSGGTIEIWRKDRLVLRATHLDSKDIPRIAEAISREV